VDGGLGGLKGRAREARPGSEEKRFRQERADHAHGKSVGKKKGGKKSADSRSGQQFLVKSFWEEKVLETKKCSPR